MVVDFIKAGLGVGTYHENGKSKKIQELIDLLPEFLVQEARNYAKTIQLDYGVHLLGQLRKYYALSNFEKKLNNTLKTDIKKESLKSKNSLKTYWNKIQKYYHEPKV